MLSDYGIDDSDVTATTEHDENVVVAFRVGLRMAHRLHTCFESMWSHTCSLHPELLKYDNHASALSKHWNQAAGVREQLPVSIKKDPQPGDGQDLSNERIL